MVSSSSIVAGVCASVVSRRQRQSPAEVRALLPCNNVCRVSMELRSRRSPFRCRHRRSRRRPDRADPVETDDHRTIAKPGTTVAHHAVVRSFAGIGDHAAPRDRAAGTPIPRKLSADSYSIIAPACWPAIAISRGGDHRQQVAEDDPRRCAPSPGPNRQMQRDAVAGRSRRATRA